MGASAAASQVTVELSGALADKKEELKDAAKEELAVRKAALLAHLGSAQKGRNMFYNPLDSIWLKKTDAMKAKASKAGLYSVILFALAAIAFIIAVMVPMDLTSSTDVVKAKVDPTLADYNDLQTKDLRDLRCKCTETTVFADKVGSWTYEMDSVCGISAIMSEAYPAATIAESFKLFGDASSAAENIAIPRNIIAALGKLAETCDISKGLMEAAQQKFKFSSIYTPEVLSETELRTLVSTLLTDQDYIWPSFFDLHSKQLDIWGAISRPLVADTYTGYAEGTNYEEYRNMDIYRACYVQPNMEGDLETAFDDTAYFELSIAAADSLTYNQKVDDNPNGQMTDVCSSLPDDQRATANFEEVIYCNPYTTFLEFPIKDITSKWVGLCAGGQEEFRTTMNNEVTGQGDIVIMAAGSSKEKPKDLLMNMMLAGKAADSLTVDHAAHFEECAPKECTWIESEKPSVASIVGIIIGIYGGFHAFTTAFIFPTVVFPLICVALGAMTFAEFQSGIVKAGTDELIADLNEEVDGVVETVKGKIPDVPESQ